MPQSYQTINHALYQSSSTTCPASGILRFLSLLKRSGSETRPINSTNRAQLRYCSKDGTSGTSFHTIHTTLFGFPQYFWHSASGTACWLYTSGLRLVRDVCMSIVPVRTAFCSIGFPALRKTRPLFALDDDDDHQMITSTTRG
jgi:hypothetical protein